jgi:hypothetical protein
MKKTTYLLAIFLFLFTSCNKKEKDIVVPDGITSLIGTFGFCQGSGSVGQYSFQGQVVYVFDPGTCGADMQAPVYNKDCVCIGALGGIAGNNIINGVLFSSNSKLIKEIWKAGVFLPVN